MSTLAELHAECLARKLGPSACADLVEPICDGRGVLIAFGEMPRCVAGEDSAQKAAVLLKEAQARQAASSPPWLLIGVGVALLVGLIYAATRH